MFIYSKIQLKSMTQIIPITHECSVCGKKVESYGLMSTNTWGSPDLDTRPPEMMRSTMNTWVQECPNCGYAAKSVKNELEIPRQYLESEEYRTCRGIEFKDELSRKFFKKHLISMKNEDKLTALYDIMHCAWACDDHQDEANAVTSRKIAIELVDELIENIEDKETLLLMKADFLRRNKEFEQLIEEYENITFSEDLLNRIIHFQIEKARKNDDACYTVEDVEKEFNQ